MSVSLDFSWYIPVSKHVRFHEPMPFKHSHYGVHMDLQCGLRSRDRVLEENTQLADSYSASVKGLWQIMKDGGFSDISITYTVILLLWTASNISLHMMAAPLMNASSMHRRYIATNNRLPLFEIIIQGHSWIFARNSSPFAGSLPTPPPNTIKKREAPPELS